MQISMWVPYDEERLRRMMKFLVRPQVKLIRVLGGVLVFLGLVLAALQPSNPVAYGCVVLGFIFAIAMGPITIARYVRMQSKIVKDGSS